jgi:putative SOS response-associated peptidase YedK
MCRHYQPLRQLDDYAQHFNATPPGELLSPDLWPGHRGHLIRSVLVPYEEGCHYVNQTFSGVFGLIPHWSNDIVMSQSNYNARSETASEKPTFRDAWRAGRHCIIPASVVFQADHRQAKITAAAMTHPQGEPIGMAGLWSSCVTPQGTLYSYTILTVNADTQALAQQLSPLLAEKRMPVILPKNRYQAWLEATPEASMGFMQANPSVQLQGSLQATYC